MKQVYLRLVTFLALLFTFHLSLSMEVQKVSTALRRSHSMDDFYPDKVKYFMDTSAHEARANAYDKCEEMFLSTYGEDNIKKISIKEAYEIRKKTICGGGDTKYSKLLLRIVDIIVEAYCASSNTDYLLNCKNYFNFIGAYFVLKRFSDLAFTVETLAEKENNHFKAVRLMKEAMFWYRLAEENNDPDAEGNICDICGWFEKWEEKI